MSEINIDPKIESLKNKAVDFVSHEAESVNDFSGKMMSEVESIVVESVEAASAKINSMMNRIGNVVKKEPFVAIAAIAISGLALANILSRKSHAKAKASAPNPSEALRH